MGSKDSILRKQVFILQQQLLIDHPVTYANRRATWFFFSKRTIIYWPLARSNFYPYAITNLG